MTIKVFVLFLCKVKKFKSLINEDKMILLKFLYIALKTYITHLLYSFFT